MKNAPLTFVLWLCVFVQAYAEPRAVEEFSLPDAKGDPIKFAHGDMPTVVCFLGTECPLANLYAPRLQQLAEQFKGVRFVAVMSNRQDSTEEIAAYRDRHELTFPVLEDRANKIADQFDAQRTPEVFLLDPDFQVRYRGRIDDQYAPGLSKLKVQREDLRVAIQAAQQNIALLEKKAFCKIGCCFLRRD